MDYQRALSFAFAGLFVLAAYITLNCSITKILIGKKYMLPNYWSIFLKIFQTVFHINKTKGQKYFGKKTMKS